MKVAPKEPRTVIKKDGILIILPNSVPTPRTIANKANTKPINVDISTRTPPLNSQYY